MKIAFLRIFFLSIKLISNNRIADCRKVASDLMTNSFLDFNKEYGGLFISTPFMLKNFRLHLMKSGFTFYQQMIGSDRYHTIFFKLMMSKRKSDKKAIFFNPITDISIHLYKITFFEFSELLKALIFCFYFGCFSKIE